MTRQVYVVALCVPEVADVWVLEQLAEVKQLVTEHAGLEGDDCHVHIERVLPGPQPLEQDEAGRKVVGSVSYLVRGFNQSGEFVDRLDEEVLDPLEQQLADLLALAEQLGVESEDMDDLVYDCKSAEAAEINNGGLESQIEYLLDSIGREELVRRLEEIGAA